MKLIELFRLLRKAELYPERVFLGFLETNEKGEYHPEGNYYGKKTLGFRLCLKKLNEISDSFNQPNLMNQKKELIKDFSNYDENEEISISVIVEKREVQEDDKIIIKDVGFRMYFIK